MPAQEYLRRILTARVYDVAIESPLEPAPRLSERLGNRATNVALSDAIEIFKISTSATVGEGVPHANSDQSCPGLTGHQSAGNNTGKTAHHPVVLDRDDHARCSEFLNQRLVIKGLQGGNVQKTKARVFHPQLIDDCLCCNSEVARDQNNDVLAIGQGPVVADPHGFVE
jgi:hypothetical protein